MKVGFTGTQKGMTDRQRVKVSILLADLNSQEFHHGDCIGADSEAHDIAQSIKLWIVIHPPIIAAKRAFRDGDEMRSPLAYLDRNKNIVNETDTLIATPGEDFEQLRSGTWSTIRYARKIRKPHLIVFPAGQVFVAKLETSGSPAVTRPGNEEVVVPREVLKGAAR